MLKYRARKRNLIKYTQVNSRTQKITGRSTTRSTLNSNHSSQTVAFLRAAELNLLDIDDTLNSSRRAHFKILVITDNDLFPVVKEIKEDIFNDGIEVNAVDLSEKGNEELKSVVTLPLSDHYIHVAAPKVDKAVENVCSNLIKVSNNETLGEQMDAVKLLRIQKDVLQNGAPRGNKDPDPIYEETLTPDKVYGVMDSFIESQSLEYKWSPHPENESPFDNIDDEEYADEDKPDICKYSRDECSLYAKNGMCSDEASELRGMKKFCTKTCNFCDQ